MEKRVHVFYSGRVQGVGFRLTAEETAKRFGVGGWVKNLRDGRVELVAEGEKNTIIRFLEEVRMGPMCKFIREVDVTWSPSASEFDEFEIRYF